jgi:hypothetical protein
VTGDECVDAIETLTVFDSIGFILLFLGGTEMFCPGMVLAG